MRVPLYEAVPVELVMSRCWVLDLNTFCKGRPVGAAEEHVYICENRVDKGARLFSKISPKSHYPVCTKSYAFEKYPQRIRPARTYAPHDVEQKPEVPIQKPKSRRQDTDSTDSSSQRGGRKEPRPVTIHVPIVRVSFYANFL